MQIIQKLIRFIVQSSYIWINLRKTSLYIHEIMRMEKTSNNIALWKQVWPNRTFEMVFKKKNYVFIWLYQILVATCGIFSCSMWDLFPWPGMEPSPLHWKHIVLGNGPPGKPPSNSQPAQVSLLPSLSGFSPLKFHHLSPIQVLTFPDFCGTLTMWVTI